jgi:hypothetical protein
MRNLCHIYAICSVYTGARLRLLGTSVMVRSTPCVWQPRSERQLLGGPGLRAWIGGMCRFSLGTHEVFSHASNIGPLGVGLQLQLQGVAQFVDNSQPSSPIPIHAPVF